MRAIPPALFLSSSGKPTHWVKIFLGDGDLSSSKGTRSCRRCKIPCVSKVRRKLPATVLGGYLIKTF